jgi:signal transduction histidine kinase
MFFLLVAFVVTCCMTLFLNILAHNLQITFESDTIALAAKLTFGNVLLISCLCATIDYIRRKRMVDQPVQQIMAALDKVMQGDFTVRIPPVREFAGETGFNEIIRAINRMTAELQGTQTLRSDFIANVSHELKTPLAVMGNYAEMLQAPGIGEAERLEYAGAIRRSARGLAALVTNILKLNKLENQQIFPKHEEFDLSGQLCEIMLGFEDAWEEKGLNIETDITDEVYICADPELLSLVWSNLISNAVKFTPRGGTVGVALRSDADGVEVTVSDTGCGIDPETGKHIFEKFYQGDTSHATEGNGLGLALVKRVIDILDGEISVRSTPGRGSSFTVRLRRNG